MSFIPSITPARTGLLQISLAAVLWGTGGLAVQLVRGRVPMSVLTISAYRMVGATVVLVAVLALSRSVHQLRVPRRTILVGVSTGAYQALYFGAVVQVGVSVATVVSLGLAPVLLTSGEAVQTRRWPDHRRLAVLAAALAGLLLVSVCASNGATGPRPALGLLLAAASGSAYAATTAAGRPLAQQSSPLALTTAASGIGGLVLLPFALGEVRAGGPAFPDDPLVLAMLAYLAIATMALAYGLLYSGLRTTSGSSAAVASLLEPVTAAVAAAAILGERIGAAGMAGIALILAAVAGLAWEEGLSVHAHNRSTNGGTVAQRHKRRCASTHSARSPQ